MKKVFTLLLSLSLLVPSVAVAADPEQPAPPASALSGYGVDASTDIASLAAAGQVVGCQTGGFGGALAQTFGAALQQAVPGLLRNLLSGPVSRLAQSAGPFGGLINTVANIGIDRLSSYLQNQIGQLLGGSSVLGTVGQALGGLGIPGVGAGVGAAAVPVNTVSINAEVRRVDRQTKATQDATETSAQKDCLGDVILRRLANALLSMTTRGIIDFANNGFNGEGAIIQNLTVFAKTVTDALIQDFVQNATAGLCSTNRGQTQVLLLQQYQYEESYSQRSQCTDEEVESIDRYGDDVRFYENIFDYKNTGLGAYMVGQSEAREQRGSAAFSSLVTYLAGDGLRPNVRCEDGSQAVAGVYCPGGLSRGAVVLTGDQAGHVIKKAITTPIDQILNADEIGELVDAFAAGLTQFIFQGIDGLAGASQREGSRGSYLDQVVGEASYAAVESSHEGVSSDIAATAETESEYLATLHAAEARVNQIRAGYQSVIACYQPVLNTSNNQIAQQRIANASSTINLILNPQIAELARLKQEAGTALSEYDSLLTRAGAAQTQGDVLVVHSDYSNFLAIGRAHTAADLLALQSNLAAADASLSLLATDARTQLSECHAL